MGWDDEAEVGETEVEDCDGGEHSDGKTEVEVWAEVGSDGETEVEVWAEVGSDGETEVEVWEREPTHLKTKNKLIKHALHTQNHYHKHPFSLLLDPLGFRLALCLFLLLFLWQPFHNSIYFFF